MGQIENLKSQQELVLTELNEVLKQLAEVLGLDCSIDYLKPIHDGTKADLHVTLQIMRGETGSAQPITKYELDWNRKCSKHGVDPSILHKVYEVNIHRTERIVKCEVLGIWGMRKQRCPIVIKEVRTGKLWKLPVESIKNAKEIPEF